MANHAAWRLHHWQSWLLARSALAQFARGKHHEYRFSGTLPTGCGLTYDGEIEGHGGFLATNIARDDQLVGWLAQKKPDIVIMHLGTNDVWSAKGPSDITSAFTKLVSQMRASKSTMKILVAKIIPTNPDQCVDCYHRVIAFNEEIVHWAATQASRRSPVSVVDCSTGFDTKMDTYDGVHPNELGNEKLASCWYAPLAVAIGKK